MTTNLGSRRATIGGITFNTLDDNGVVWGMDQLDGWGSPGSDTEYTKKPAAHGSWASGPGKMPERSIALGGIVAAPTPELRAAAEDRIIAAFALDLTKLEVVEPGRSSRWVMVQRDGEVLTPPLNDNSFKWSAQVKAPDPLKYGDPIVLITGLPSSSGGITWPTTWPIEWDAQNVSGVIHIDNPGNIASPLFLTIYGPVVAPRVRHVGQGVEVALSSAYTVGGGSQLNVDMANQIVTEGTTAPRNGWLIERGFFLLDPGPNDLIFSAAAYNPTARLLVTTYPAYQ